MDLQLNITIPKKSKKKTALPQDSSSKEYKFLPKANFSGRTIARKRRQDISQQNSTEQPTLGIPKQKQPKFTESSNKDEDTSTNLLDLSENKGKYHGKNYQEISDDVQTRQKPRSGGWISSLFKNNPEVPRMGQRAVKPLTEKVFAGKTFSDLHVHPHSVANIQQNLNLKELMTVQQNAIPVILQGRDVLIRSQTGSGKTLAFALPLVEGLQAIRPKINRHDGIRAVVIVPTRELAVQTYELFVKLVKPFTWVVPGLLSGGQKRKAEKARLRKGLSILVGTPGRINDHLRHTKSLNFSKTGCLILDEADRLLDMGYEKDVAEIVKSIEEHKKAATYDPMALVKQTVNKKIFADDDETVIAKETATESEQNDIKHHLTEVFLGKERQTILLSATLTKAVENLAGLTMVDPVFVDTSEGRALVADSLKSGNIVKLNTKKPKSKKVEIPEPNVTTKVEDHKEIATDTGQQQKETKQGLKQFCGIKYPDLFSPKEGDSIKVIPKTETELDSDSDSGSDYEYFKVQKELNMKQTVNEQEEIEPSVSENTFREALHSAITEDELVLPAAVNQTYLIIPMKLRLVTLCSLIVQHCVLNKKGGKIIVFMATLEMVDYHAELLDTVLTGKEDKPKEKTKEKKSKKNQKTKSDDNDADATSSSEEESESEYKIDYEIPSDSPAGLVPVDLDIFRLHGSMPHEQRMEVFKQFRVAKAGVLICTDVAARGLDVPRVDLVLQYCAPASATDYVHRVGRTGRATHAGSAVMFLLPSESEFVRHLEEKRIRLRQTDESSALEALRLLAPSAPSAQRAAIALQTRLEYIAHSSREWLARASRAYTSWVRFYSGYPRDVRHCLDAKQLHLGHAAKAFAMRDPPAALARRATNDPTFKKQRPENRLTVLDEVEKKRPGFARVKVGTSRGPTNRQSSMHTASEFDSGLAPADSKKKKKKSQ